MHLGEVLGRVVRTGGEPGGVLPRVLQVPDVLFGEVVAHIGEEHRGAGDLVHDLHGEGAVHVALGCTDDRRLGAVEVVRIVQEGLGDVGGGEVVRQLGLALDPAEVDLALLDDLAHGVVRTDLALEDLGGELLAVVVDARCVLLQPLPPGHSLVSGDELGPADDLVLVDLLHVDAEPAHPLVGTPDRRVHPHGATADTGEGGTLQRHGRVGGADQLLEPSGYCAFFYVTPEPLMATSQLVEAATGGQHPDHARIGGVDVGEQKHGTNGGVCGVDGKVRPRPHRVVEDGEVGSLRSQAAGFPHRHRVRGDGLGPPHHLGAECLAGGRDASFHICRELGYALMNEVATIAEGENSDTRHWTLLENDLPALL